MNKSIQSININWEKVSGSLANLSKRWWAISILIQLSIVIINMIMVFDDNLAKILSFIVAALSIGYVLSQWQFEHLKRLSDSVKRKFELQDGLGWGITPKEVSDLIVSIPEKIIENSKNANLENYFASVSEPSSTRLLQNLEESSWWTKHLAGSMMKITAVICAIIFSVATVTLIIVLQTITNQTISIIFAKIVVSIIVYAFSAGYFRMTFDYFRFSKGAEKAEEQCVQLLSDKKIPEITALKVLHEYQILRAGAPQIPTWIWSIRQRRLNQTWKLRRELESS